MNTLQTFIASLPGGFITTKEDEDKLLKLDRLCPVLVRCGGCRFTCAVQDVEHLTSCITAGGDYVRDVSLPVGSMERAANWQPERVFTNERPATQPDNAWHLNHARQQSDRARIQFNENDCGGVFNGHGVVSDADSGL